MNLRFNIGFCTGKPWFVAMSELSTSIFIILPIFCGMYFHSLYIIKLVLFKLYKVKFP